MQTTNNAPQNAAAKSGQKRGITKWLFAVLIVAAMMISAVAALGLGGGANPQSVYAADNSPTATFNIQTATWSSGTAADHNCVWDGTVLAVNNGANIAVTGTATIEQERRIEVNGTAAITLKGVSITESGANQSPLLLNQDANLTLTLAAGTENTFFSTGNDRAGIEVSQGSTLTIDGAGSVTATGRNGGAGIGGRADGIVGSIVGNIIIKGGTVTARGASTGAGIGGGRNSDGGNITITGGTVTATGGSNGAAGIGGGQVGNGGNITISGGTVTATGRLNAAGIGGGSGRAGGTITINGGTITASSGESGAGIGGGLDGGGGTITINGGTVTATGGSDIGGLGGGAGIGGGRRAGAGGTVTISGGMVVAIGSGGTSAGIGRGNGTASGGTLTLPAGGNAMVFTNSVTDTDASRRTSGILVVGTTTHWYSANANTDPLIINYDAIVPALRTLTIPASRTLTIAPGATLTVQSGATLAITGTLQNNGSVILINMYLLFISRLTRQFIHGEI